MDNQIDNDLKNHIKDVFGRFEDPSADAGWLLLREKYPEKKRRSIAWFWWSAAAVLLLFIGIGFFKMGDKAKHENIAYKPIKPHQQHIVADKNSATAGKSGLTVHNIVLNASITKTKKTDSLKKEKSYLAAKQTEVTPANIFQQPSITNKPVTAKLADTSSLVASIKVQSKQPIMDSAQNKNNNSIAANTGSVIRKPASSIYTSNGNEPKNEPDKSYNKKVRFGIYGATFVNYAKNSNTSVNAGAGVTTEIPISKNLKLITGVALAQNTLNYSGDLGTVNYNLSNNATTSPTNTSQQQSYNASLLSLDVPVNLKYEFTSHSKLFVSAGLSSGTFIGQNYSSGFLQSSLASSGKNTNDFYFARVLNVSFGMNYPLSKTNSLVVEPFLKYPLGGLGNQQIKFGTSGINLKFNFKTSPK